jgi:hypothetical protein
MMPGMTSIGAGSDVRNSAEARAEALKERVYITFTALAVVLAMREHVESAETALITLLIAVVGTLLAVFVADVVSHIAVHAVLPTRPELQHMLRISLGAIGAVVLPFVFLTLAVRGWRLEAALRASSIALLAALVAIGYAAVRRLRLPLWQRLLVLLAEFVLGLLVLGLELLAHG